MMQSGEIKFRNGEPVPDDEVRFDPNVQTRYGEASQDRLADLKWGLAAVMVRVPRIERKLDE